MTVRVPAGLTAADGTVFVNGVSVVAGLAVKLVVILVIMVVVPLSLSEGNKLSVTDRDNDLGAFVIFADRILAVFSPLLGVSVKSALGAAALGDDVGDAVDNLFLA